MKYINQLSPKDWAVAFREMFPDADFKEDKIRIESNSDGESLTVLFLECWEDEEYGKKYLDTRYTFRDFESPECLDCNYSEYWRSSMKSGFFSYMFIHFGTDYMKDFVYDKTEVQLHMDGFGLTQL